MLKFNNLVNKIIVECSDSNIISEDVTVNDIRDMIKQMDKSKAERLRRYFFDDFTYIFYTAESRLRENKLNDIDKIIINDIETTIVDKNEFIRNFISSLSDKELIPKTIMSKLADTILDKIKDTDITKDDIVNFLRKHYFYHHAGYSQNYYYKIKREDYQQILRDIDASHITDDDIKVYTPETFKSYNRKAKGAFSYAIFLKENLPIAIAHFFSDGTIDNIEAVDKSFSKQINVKQVIEKSDKIIAISNEYRNNIKQRQPYHEKSDDEIRRENQMRLYKKHFKNDIEKLLNSIKEDLYYHKEMLMNIVFDDNDDITKAFSTFKFYYNAVKRELNKYLTNDHKSESRLIDLVNDLKLKYRKLTELLEEEK